MKKYSPFILLFCICACQMISSVPSQSSGEEPSEDIVILFTNDLHSQIEPISKTETYNADKGGLVRMKVLVDSVRAAEKAVILADAGDFVQGTFYFTCLDGDVEMKAQEAMGYDIRTVGNHEFDKKISGMQYMFGQNSVVTVSSNYDFSGTPLSNNIVPKAIIETGGHKIGFIGLGARLEGLVNPKSCEGVEYSYPSESADRLARELKNEGAEMVIALSHLGFNRESTAKYYDKGFVAATSNIDFVIGGHSHTFLMQEQYVTNLAGKEVPIVQTGSKGIYLGYMKIRMNKSGRERFSYRLIPVNGRLDSRADPTFAGIMEGYKRDLDQTMSEVLGYCPTALRKGSPEGKLGNWTTDAMVEICKDVFGVTPDFAICNNGGLRAEFPSGALTRDRIFATYPFDNKFCLLELKGAVVLQLFDAEAKSLEPVSSSVRLEVCNGEVVSVKLNGQDIDPEGNYRICTIDYLSDTGRFGMDKYRSRTDSEKYQYELFSDYVKALTAAGKKIQASIDGRVTVVGE